MMIVIDVALLSLLLTPHDACWVVPPGNNIHFRTVVFKFCQLSHFFNDHVIWSSLISSINQYVHDIPSVLR